MISKALKQNDNNIEKRKEKEIIDRVNFFPNICMRISLHTPIHIYPSLLGIQKHVNVLKGTHWIIKCHQSFYESSEP
jgi:hypothetical protein